MMPAEQNLPLAAPPLLPQSSPSRRSTSGRDLLALLLNAGLVLFLADAVVSLADALAILAFHSHSLSGLRAVVLLTAMGILALIYLLLGITPLVPKKYFLPVTLFNPLCWLALIPCMIFFYKHLAVVDVIVAALQVVAALATISWVQRGRAWHWPLIREDQFGTKSFSGKNLALFLVANLVAAPLLISVYLAVCAATAVDHFSGGFLKLQPGGVTVQAREYARADGKTILLVPMVHIGDADFYDKVSQSFPTNSIVLLEGVTDENNLLTNRLSYHRAANSLGLAEQQKAFHPTRGKLVRADVDVGEFSSGTIDLLNVAMLIHSKGLTPKSALEAMEHSTPPTFQEILVDDLVTKRNKHLLKEINARLSAWDKIVVPWGAAHIPGIAAEIQKAGFSLVGSRDYRVIRFFGRKAPASHPD